MTNLRERLRALNMARGCTAPGCAKAVKSLGTLCPTHLRARQTHGHPLARCPDANVFGPFIDAACVFIHRDRKHPGIIATIDWIEARIAEGEYRTAQRGGAVDPRNAHCRRDDYWARLRAVGSIYVLAVILAVYTYEQQKTDAFLDHAHFGATITHLLTRKAPAKVTGQRPSGKLLYAEKARVLPPRARELWLAQILPVLGAPARVLARHVAAIMQAPPPPAAFKDLDDAA